MMLINIKCNQYVMYFYGSRLRLSWLLFLFHVNLLQQHVGGLLQ